MLSKTKYGYEFECDYERRNGHFCYNSQETESGHDIERAERELVRVRITRPGGPQWRVVEPGRVHVCYLHPKPSPPA